MKKNQPADYVNRQAACRLGKYFSFCILGISLLGAACQAAETKTVYQCSGEGYIFRYRNSKKIGQDNTHIAFSLGIDPSKDTYEISANEIIAEQNDARVVLDRHKSNTVERVYVYDRTDPASQERTVTSLVINQVNGDFRIFHHRWILPAEWKDSDQYFYAGKCMKSQSQP